MAKATLDLATWLTLRRYGVVPLPAAPSVEKLDEAIQSRRGTLRLETGGFDTATTRRRRPKPALAVVELAGQTFRASHPNAALAVCEALAEALAAVGDELREQDDDGQMTLFDEEARRPFGAVGSVTISGNGTQGVPAVTLGDEGGAAVSFGGAIESAVAQRRARLGDEHESARPLEPELRALALADRFAEAWPGGLVRLGQQWFADTVSLLRGAVVPPLPCYHGEAEPIVGPLAPVARVQCSVDQGCDAPDLVARYGEWIAQPRQLTWLYLDATPEPAELAALVAVLGPWAADEVARRIGLAAFGHWESNGGPEPCFDAMAEGVAHDRFTGRVRLTVLHPNRFWRVEPEHGPRGYVRFWPASEGGQPRWAWHLKGSGGWSRGTTGHAQHVDEADLPRLTGRDRLARAALELARLREPAPPPAPDDAIDLDRLHDELAAPAEQLALFA